jgi:hypothetical protein
VEETDPFPGGNQSFLEETKVSWRKPDDSEILKNSEIFTIIKGEKL